MARLSRLSFMNPLAISANISTACRYAGLPKGSLPLDIFQSLQGLPAGVIGRGQRHQRVELPQVAPLKSLITGIMGGQFPPSFALFDEATFCKQLPLATRGEQQWRQLCSEDFQCYENLIGAVIYAYRDSYSGGSVSNAIGWIWLSPEPHWTHEDYSQSLVHEYTHNVLFLEEMVHTLFSVSAEVMAQPENRVVSSIRRVPRYFDQSFHAAAVAIVLAEFAILEKRYTEARQLVHGLLPSLDAMKEKRSLMTNHGFLILQEMIFIGLEMHSALSFRKTNGRDSFELPAMA